MHRGYVKLWRKSQDSRVFQNAELWKVWTWCLIKANHEPKWVTIKSGKGDINVYVESGQFIFGRESAASELRMKPSSVRNRIAKLESMRKLDIKPDRQFSIISIINWGVYQQPQEDCGQPEGQPKDSQRTAKGQPKDTNKNDKNYKNVKNVKNTKGKKQFSPPTPEETIQFFVENGFSEQSAKKAHAYYQDNNWKDSRDNPVKNWKQKMRGVWFKDENKSGNDKHNNFKEREYVGTPDEEISWLQN